MTFATRLLPPEFVAGEVRTGAIAMERRWVDLMPGAFDRLALRRGDRVMVHTVDGDRVPGVVTHDGSRLAIYCDAELTRDRVTVRRTKGI